MLSLVRAALDMEAGRVRGEGEVCHKWTTLVSRTSASTREDEGLAVTMRSTCV